MYIHPIATRIVKAHDDLLQVITEAIEQDMVLQGKLPEKSILAITSKIISYSQGRLVKKTHSEAQGFTREQARAEKHALVAKEAELFLDPHSSKYDLMLTITNQTLAVNAGIDESNAHSDGEECFVLWPEHLQETINQLWERLRAHYQIQHLGLIVTDSRSFPLRWGVVGTTIGHCGFRALNNHIGQKDIFGREIHMVQVNAAEAIGVAATFEMGEVGETTPLAVVTDAPKVVFTKAVPSAEELAAASISIADDAYAPLLTAVAWQKGGKNHDA